MRRIVRWTFPLFLMHNTTDTGSSPPHSGRSVARAQADPHLPTAPSALTSGFGAVIEKEHDLQSATEGSLGHVSGQHATEIDRILRLQHSRLGANIALLEQRYEALPNPERFVSWNDRRRPPSAPRRTESRDEAELLPDLIARHTGLLADLEALIGCGPDSQRAELILTEVRRNHEEMARMLTALLKDDATAGRSTENGNDRASKSTRQAEESWDNEGGPVTRNPPSS